MSEPAPKPSESSTSPTASPVAVGEAPRPRSEWLFWGPASVLLAVLAFGLVTQLPAARQSYFCWKFERARTSALREYWARAIMGLPSGRGVTVLRQYALGPDEQQAITAAVILWISNADGADEAWRDVQAAWPPERRRAFEAELLSRVSPLGPGSLPPNLPGLLPSQSPDVRSLDGAGPDGKSPDGKSPDGASSVVPPMLPDWAKPVLEAELKARQKAEQKKESQP